MFLRVTSYVQIGAAQFLNFLTSAPYQQWVTPYPFSCRQADAAEQAAWRSTGEGQAAARRGLAVHGLAPYRISCEGRPGLIFGYATLSERKLTEGVEILAEAISDARLR